MQAITYCKERRTQLTTNSTHTLHAHVFDRTEFHHVHLKDPPKSLETKIPSTNKRTRQDAKGIALCSEAREAKLHLQVWTPPNDTAPFCVNFRSHALSPGQGPDSALRPCGRPPRTPRTTGRMRPVTRGHAHPTLVSATAPSLALAPGPQAPRSTQHWPLHARGARRPGHDRATHRQQAGNQRDNASPLLPGSRVLNLTFDASGPGVPGR